MDWSKLGTHAMYAWTHVHADSVPVSTVVDAKHLAGIW